MIRYEGFVEVILTNKYLEHFNVLMCVINHNSWVLCNTKELIGGLVSMHKTLFELNKTLMFNKLETIWVLYEYNISLGDFEIILDNSKSIRMEFCVLSLGE